MVDSMLPVHVSHSLVLAHIEIHSPWKARDTTSSGIGILRSTTKLMKGPRHPSAVFPRNIRASLQQDYCFATPFVDSTTPSGVNLRP